MVEQSRKKDQECPMLIEGVCPHGLTGKTCEYIHKKVCNRYSQYGSKEMHRWGCRFGENCRYVHLTLCNNSVEMGMCLNKSCKHAHLKDTDRKKGYARRQQPRSFSGPRQENGNANSYNVYSHRSNYQQTLNPNTNSFTLGNDHTQSSSNNFLEKAMERMQKMLSHQIQQQIQMQFKQLQEEKQYNIDYPRSMPQTGNQTWNYMGTEGQGHQNQEW